MSIEKKLKNINNSLSTITIVLVCIALNTCSSCSDEPVVDVNIDGVIIDTKTETETTEAETESNPADIFLD